MKLNLKITCQNSIQQCEESPLHDGKEKLKKERPDVRKKQNKKEWFAKLLFHCYLIATSVCDER